MYECFEFLMCVCFEYLVRVSTCAVCVTGVWRTEEDAACPHMAVGSPCTQGPLREQEALLINLTCPSSAPLF